MRQFIRTNTSITLFVGTVVATNASAMIAFDAADDFSALSNPNGVWSYGYASTSTGAMSLLLSNQTRFEPASLPGWARDSAPVSASLPAVFHNPGAAPVSVVDYPAPIDPGALVVHPGDLPDEDFVIVRFTAPATSDYDITATFKALDTTAGVQSLVIVNSATILFDQTFAGFGNSSSYDSMMSVGLTTGDTIDFVVGHAGAFVNDSVQLGAVVIQIPSPGAAVIALPLGAICALRRRSI